MIKNLGNLALRHDLDQAILTLISTDGYKKLDSLRQSLLREALKIQHQFDHHIVFGSPKDNYKFVQYAIFLADINCFNSVSCIERGVSFKHAEHPKSAFFEGEYSLVRFSITAQVVFFVSRKSYPSVVHIGMNTPNTLPFHSLIALGETQDEKDIIVWEKGSKDHPYALTTISKIIERYQNLFWAVRPFQTPR